MAEGTSAKQGRNRHFVALDSWRGIAALAVAFGHFKTSGMLSALPLATTSYRFVDFFFVLSGFVIAHSSGERLASSRAEIGPFMIRRLARLWPLHLFVLALFAFYQLALLIANSQEILRDPRAFTDGFQLAFLPANIFLLQAWELVQAPSWNKPAWSISAELFAYIVFAAAAAILRHRAWIALALLAAIAGVWITSDPQIMAATFHLALVRAVAGFGLGVVAYRLWTMLADRALAGATAWEAVCVLALVAVTVWIPESWGYLILPVYFWVIVIFAREQGRISAWLRSRPFVVLGERSYSIYLIHPLLLIGIAGAAQLTGFWGEVQPGKRGLVAPPLVGDLALLAFLALVIVISGFTYRWIEMPGQRLGKRLGLRADKPGKSS